MECSRYLRYALVPFSWFSGPPAQNRAFPSGWVDAILNIIFNTLTTIDTKVGLNHVLPSKNQRLRRHISITTTRRDYDDDDDDDDQRMDGSAMRYPVLAGTAAGAHHNHPLLSHNQQQNNHSMRNSPTPVSRAYCDSHRLIIPSRGGLHCTIFRPRQFELEEHINLRRVRSGGPVLPSITCRVSCTPSRIDP
jgi:hypothetical protein